MYISTGDNDAQLTVVGCENTPSESKDWGRQSQEQQQEVLAQSDTEGTEEPLQAVPRIADPPRETLPSHNGRQPHTNMTKTSVTLVPLCVRSASCPGFPIDRTTTLYIFSFASK